MRALQSPPQDISDNPVVDHDYALELESILSDQLKNHVQQLKVVVNNHGIVLHGISTSYQTKLFAEELLKQYGSTEQRCNRIVVCDSGSVR